ncbi:hypothetical protein RJ641_009110 [Dillenia turbinata]|uniref:Uncharacterized protein n=1 Tax=Dillenia turbinata TaxID=194707 RepID=A0AAN8V4J5_9MAGN
MSYGVQSSHSHSAFDPDDISVGAYELKDSGGPTIIRDLQSKMNGAKPIWVQLCTKRWHQPHHLQHEHGVASGCSFMQRFCSNH